MNMKNKIINMGRKGWGIGRIFRKLRGLKISENYSDYTLFARILRVLSEHNFRGHDHSFTKPKIRYHFHKNVSPDNYAEQEKREIFEHLYELGGQK
jgi:hypothetical protein